MNKEYMNGLIKVIEEKEDEFHVYVCMCGMKKLNAILFGEVNRDIFLKGLGIEI